MKYTFSDPVNWSQRSDSSEDIVCIPSQVPTIGDVIATRFNRRDQMKGALGITAIAATVRPLALAASKARAAEASSFDFPERAAGVSTDHAVADGYDADVLIRWGDPVVADAPAFAPNNQSADAQKKQFGYNNDYVATVSNSLKDCDSNRKTASKKLLGKVYALSRILRARLWQNY